jgi:diaminopimelate epimerase
MKIPFIKMHGAGNDYIYVDCRDNAELEEYVPKIAERISARRFGIGGDGIVLICSSKTANVKMRIFNADGSEAKMCGNGIRCVAKLVGSDKVTIETLSGIKCVERIGDNFRVDMGIATMSRNEVDIGNLHKVFIYRNIDKLDVEKLARPSPDYNVEFVQIVDKSTIRIRVRERGSGETLSCGTGAAAAVVFCAKKGYLDISKPVVVHLAGGDLVIEIIAGKVFMTGSAVTVYKGEIDA